MKAFIRALLLLTLSVTTSLVFADIEDMDPPFPKPTHYEGSFTYFPDIPNTLFLLGEVKADSELKFRRAIRNHNIEKFVLLSPGGSVDAGLSIAQIARDKGIYTYIPTLPDVNERTAQALPEVLGCMSACSFIFFGGETRFANGPIGIHQIRSVIDPKEIEGVEVPLQDAMDHFEQNSQATVSEIISALNSLDVPPEIYEYMFEKRKMYFLNARQTRSVVNGSDEDWHIVADKRVNDYYQFAQLLMDELDKDNGSQGNTDKPTPQQKAPESNPDKEILRTVQTLLNQHGCDAGPADGVLGNRTKEAFVRFADATSLTEEDLKKYDTDSFIALLRNTPFPACTKNLPRKQDLPQPYGPATFEGNPSLVGAWDIAEQCSSNGGNKNYGKATISAPGYDYLQELGGKAIKYDFNLQVKGFVIRGYIYESVRNSSIRIRFNNDAPQEMRNVAFDYSGYISANRDGFRFTSDDCSLTGDRQTAHKTSVPDTKPVNKPIDKKIYNSPLLNKSSLVGDWAVLEKCKVNGNVRIVRGQATVTAQQFDQKPDAKYDSVKYEVFYINQFEDKFDGWMNESERSLYLELKPLAGNKYTSDLKYRFEMSKDRNTMLSTTPNCTTNAYRIKK